MKAPLEGAVTREDVLAATESVAPALEILDTRIARQDASTARLERSSTRSPTMLPTEALFWEISAIHQRRLTSGGWVRSLPRIMKSLPLGSVRQCLMIRSWDSLAFGAYGTIWTTHRGRTGCTLRVFHSAHRMPIGNEDLSRLWQFRPCNSEF